MLCSQISNSISWFFFHRFSFVCWLLLRAHPLAWLAAVAGIAAVVVEAGTPVVVVVVAGIVATPVGVQAAVVGLAVAGNQVNVCFFIKFWKIFDFHGFKLWNFYNCPCSNHSRNCTFTWSLRSFQRGGIVNKIFLSSILVGGGWSGGGGGGYGGGGGGGWNSGGGQTVKVIKVIVPSSGHSSGWQSGGSSGGWPSGKSPVVWFECRESWILIGI